MIKLTIKTQKIQYATTKIQTSRHWLIGVKCRLLLSAATIKFKIKKYFKKIKITNYKNG